MLNLNNSPMKIEDLKVTDASITISRGMFDLLKDQIRRRKLSPYNAAKLDLELKTAIQVLRRDIPTNVVAINSVVTVKEQESGAETQYTLVAPQMARNKNKTTSITSDIGVALVGYKEGDMVKWEVSEGVLKTFTIVSVTRLVNTRYNTKNEAPAEVLN